MSKTHIWWTCFWKSAKDLRTIFLTLLAIDIGMYWWLKDDPTLMGMAWSIATQVLAYFIINIYFTRSFYKEVLATMPWLK